MTDIRIDKPKEDIQKFKEVFLYILEKVGCKSNVGKTVLVKLLYFIDFDFYELYETQLMGMRYVKKQYGPYPLIFDEMINQMIDDKDLIQSNDAYFDKYQQKYLPTRAPDLDYLSHKELEHINKTLDKYSDKTANWLSDYSHKDIPWICAKDNAVLKYEGVFYRTEHTSVRNYDEVCK